MHNSIAGDNRSDNRITFFYIGFATFKRIRRLIWRTTATQTFTLTYIVLRTLHDNKYTHNRVYLEGFFFAQYINAIFIKDICARMLR